MISIAPQQNVVCVYQISRHEVIILLLLRGKAHSVLVCIVISCCSLGEARTQTPKLCFDINQTETLFNLSSDVIIIIIVPHNLCPCFNSLFLRRWRGDCQMKFIYRLQKVNDNKLWSCHGKWMGETYLGPTSV